MNIAALRPVLCMPGWLSRSSSSTFACGASACANDAPAMPAPTMTASKSASAITRRGACSARALRRITHQRALAEQALDQVDCEFGGAVAHVERGVELHHVERCKRAGVGDHLHAELRLAIGRAAAHGGVDAGCDLGVEEVDVEA